MERKKIEEFRDTGLLMFINIFLHIFGWAIVAEIDKDVQPKFINEAYCDNFKKRLYTKDKNKYECFKAYGESYENWYYIGNNWKFYKQK